VLLEQKQNHVGAVRRRRLLRVAVTPAGCCGSLREMLVNQPVAERKY
jgi:hypothetical protein